jgi:hypothetical protein
MSGAMICQADLTGGFFDNLGSYKLKQQNNNAIAEFISNDSSKANKALLCTISKSIIRAAKTREAKNNARIYVCL